MEFNSYFIKMIKMVINQFIGNENCYNGNKCPKSMMTSIDFNAFIDLELQYSW